MSRRSHRRRRRVLLSKRIGVRWDGGKLNRMNTLAEIAGMMQDAIPTLYERHDGWRLRDDAFDVVTPPLTRD